MPDPYLFLDTDVCSGLREGLLPNGGLAGLGIRHYAPDVRE